MPNRGASARRAPRATTDQPTNQSRRQGATSTLLATRIQKGLCVQPKEPSARASRRRPSSAWRGRSSLSSRMLLPETAVCLPPALRWAAGHVTAPPAGTRAPRAIERHTVGRGGDVARPDVPASRFLARDFTVPLPGFHFSPTAARRAPICISRRLASADGAPAAPRSLGPGPSPVAALVACGNGQCCVAIFSYVTVAIYSTCY